MPRLSLYLLFAILGVFTLATPIHAQATTTPVSVTCGTNGINTGLGCISTNPSEFVSQIVQLAIGIGGALGLLLILYGFFIVTTSAGIPDKIKAGQEVITSAIIGLVFLTLSVVMMRFLGITIFNLPGLN